jgi:anthranilate/para-aminobenzoate synthase component II
MNNIEHEFSAGFEYKHYPFFGLQFHPEKIIAETYLDA